jgi:hypothetical protein
VSVLVIVGLPGLGEPRRLRGVVSGGVSVEFDRVSRHLHERVLQRGLLDSQFVQADVVLEGHIADRFGTDAAHLELAGFLARDRHVRSEQQIT